MLQAAYDIYLSIYFHDHLHFIVWLVFLWYKQVTFEVQTDMENLSILINTLIFIIFGSVVLVEIEDLRRQDE